MNNTAFKQDPEELTGGDREPPKAWMWEEGILRVRYCLSKSVEAGKPRVCSAKEGPCLRDVI